MPFQYAIHEAFLLFYYYYDSELLLSLYRSTFEKQ